MQPLTLTFQTTSALGTFVLAMARYPGAFSKAQAEMDRVIGHDRLPSLDDMDSLPYLVCLYKEVFRYVACCTGISKD
jgi:cytochrome P450